MTFLKGKASKTTKELTRANKKLQYANDKLQQVDKAKSEFLSIASHQLRTPLSGIMGYLSMLLEGDFGKVPPKINKVIKELYQNSDRMSRLINTFLNISRIEANRLVLDKEEVNFTRLLRNAFKEFKSDAAKKKIKYTLDIPKEKILLNIDGDKIRDVIVNIIDNAIKYTIDGEIKVIAEADEKRVIVKVDDTGVGMKPSEVQYFFQKFSRGTGITQMNTAGSGLGLYIVKKIIEAHGGEAFAKSKGKGNGSIFGIELPIVD